MIAINREMQKLGEVRSVIRDLFEFGLQRSAVIGRENVFDYSLGNPSVPAPDCVNDTIRKNLDTMDSITLHGYTSAAGDMKVRQAIADSINARFSAGINKEDIYITCGAAASLTITLNALTCPGDEVIAVAPFFPEYRVFAEKAGAAFVVVPADTEHFQINLKAFEAAITAHTKAVILNSPNNPSGAILTRENLEGAIAVLKRKSEEFGHRIYIISDEPYRELVYDDIEVPYLINEYDDTIVCYSFSKSLSMPGERIGYIVVSNRTESHEEIFAAVAGAGRALGYVCAPSLMQRIVCECLGQTSDLSAYKENRDLLYNALVSFGYEVVHPDGAFYLFMKAPGGDAKTFSEKAKEFELLLVPSDSFGCPGYVRLAYCVSNDMIRRSLPAFEKLIQSV